MQQNKTPLSSDYDTTISLLNTYFSEWSHRDQILWSQVFKFYYAILIIIILPNIAPHFDLYLPPMPDLIFRFIGLILSIVFLYISFGYVIRLQAISDTYNNLIISLPENYKRESIENIKSKNIPIGKIFKPRLSYMICFSLFFSLVFLSIIFIVI